MKKIVRLTESDMQRIVKKIVSEKEIKEYYGREDSSFSHSLDNIRIESVLEGLDLLKHYRPEIYHKFFGDRIFNQD